MKKEYGDQNGRNPSKAALSKAARLQGLSKKQGDMPDWSRINSDLIHGVIVRATRDDGAVRFGYSRDGGAYAVALYLGGAPDTAYFHSDEEITDYLTRVWEALNED